MLVCLQFDAYNMNKVYHIHSLFVLCALFVLASCGVYSFRDVSIPPEVKTVRIQLIGNQARYINPQLSPQLTDKLRQKINNQTRLTPIQSEEAHYDIAGYVSDYSVTTAGISNQQAATNRLTVTIHIVFQNRLDPAKNFEADVSRNFDFSAALSLNQAEAQLGETIVRNMTDEIFNRIFSNW
jgi:outer membrane lipopolysaccharide assembly protein LptE/RlpB